MKQRVYYSEEQWKAWMTECCNSGLKIKDWCEQHGLSDNLFFRWRKRLLDQGKIVWKPSVNTTNTGNDQLPAVVQVNLSDLSDDIPSNPGRSFDRTSLVESIRASQIVIETPVTGYHVYVGTGFSQETLKQIMEVLR